MKAIKKFDVSSVMRMSGLIYGFLGLIEGLMFGVFLWIAPLAAPNLQGMPHFGILFGALCVIFFPILFALMGALMGGASAYVYNVASKFVGGILVEVQ